ncbi:hypothetical protein MNBD_UNCLBAC01-1560 [hydrothermal vent metagenome]|uniref:DUF3313 domain-containing protein n=1 Tax=hydrothermal vent metagenome TaxID=652676 RepID=A0A3B1DLT4_9ZZZZ
MRGIKKYIWILGFMMIFMSGCATRGAVPSGFLNDYSGLKPSLESKNLYIEERMQRGIGVYNKVMIDPVVVYFQPDARGDGINPVKLQELTDFFEEQIQESISEGYTIVNEVQEGTLRIRVAVTDIVSNKQLLNIHWTTTLAGWGLGGAAMEVEFLDGQTGERVLAMIDSRKGKRTKYFKGLMKWGHTEDVLSQWAKMITQKMEEL